MGVAAFELGVGLADLRQRVDVRDRHLELPVGDQPGQFVRVRSGKRHGGGGARELAHHQIAATEQTMLLEDQATGKASEMEDRLTEQLVERGGLWSRSVQE